MAVCAGARELPRHHYAASKGATAHGTLLAPGVAQCGLMVSQILSHNSTASMQPDLLEPQHGHKGDKHSSQPAQEPLHVGSKGDRVLGLQSRWHTSERDDGGRGWRNNSSRGGSNNSSIC